MKIKRKIRVMTAPVLTWGVVFLDSVSIGFFIFLSLYVGFDDTSLIKVIIFGICLVGIPIIASIIVIRFCFTIFTIDERGIRRSAFGFMYRLEMKWEDIKEMSYQSWFFPYVWITKDKPIGLVESNNKQVFTQLYKRKDLIQIHLSRKIYNTIRQYTDISIIGLTEETIKELKLE